VIVNNLVIVSDLHCGCQGGLCPPGGAKLDQGGRYTPSACQEAMWAWWCEFWHEWLPEAGHGEPFAVVVNGDAIDGCHHGTTHQISHNLSDQASIAYEVLAPIREQATHFYLVRGTEAHTGKSGEEEEKLGARLACVKDPLGNYSRQEVSMLVGNNCRVNCMHHIGTAGSSAYESSAILKELIEAYVNAGTWGREPYDVVVRSHRHTYMSIDRPSHKGYAISLTTPGWQAKTPFAYKVAGSRQATPHFGGVLIRQGDHDFYRRAFVRSIDPPPDEVLDCLVTP